MKLEELRKLIKEELAATLKENAPAKEKETKEDASGLQFQYQSRGPLFAPRNFQLLHPSLHVNK